MNNGSPTTVPYPNRHVSAIDLCLVSSPLAHLCNWYVLDDPIDNYHLPTLLELNILSSIYDLPPPVNKEKYVYSKADWTKYSPINIYNNFVNVLYFLRDKTSKSKYKISSNKRIKKSVPCWN